jgi:hypothetical protein
MKNAAFVFSTLSATVCLILSVVVFFHGRDTQSLQAQITTQQQEFQLVEQTVQSKQEEFQRQQQIIEAGANVAQKYGKAILTDVGIRAVKNKNQNLRDLLVRYRLDSAFILSEEDLKRLEQESAQRNSQGSPAQPK